MRIVIVGGGVVGTMHAWAARRRGHEVVQLEADGEPRRASVRNFGLVWVSGRARGRELALARRSRELWEQLADSVPGIGFRPDGSLTVAQHPAELAVLEELAAESDASERGLALLDPGEVRTLNPAVRGELVGALHCRLDAIVEPRQLLPAVRASLAARGGYEFLAGRVVRDVASGAAHDATGTIHRGDVVLVCPGAAHGGVFAPLLTGVRLRRCRLQMMQTASWRERLPTALADGDTLRYYPAFDLPTRAGLPTPAPAVRAHRAQLLIAQRSGGELTIGDTHAYEEPFDFAVDEEPYDHLRARAESLLGVAVPRIERRWAGVYSQGVDDEPCVRVAPGSGIVVVTGLGGRGMTLSPAVAEETLEQLEALAA